MIFCLFLFPLVDVQDQQEISTGDLKIFETVYTCEKCPKIFTSEISLRLHQRSLHESFFDDTADAFDDDDSKMWNLKHPTKFTNSFDSQAKIMPTENHETQYQTSTRCTRNKEDFTCGVCNQVFTYRRALENHIDYVHETVGLNPKKYRCSECPSSFKYQNNIQKHSNSRHHVLKSGNDLKSESDSSIEERRNFLCNFCGRSYSHLVTLEEHIDVYHRSRSGRPQSRWKCEDGPISHSIKRNQNRHRLDECNVCRFKETQNHLSCNFCKQTFRHKRTLECHVDYVHEEEKLIPEKYRCRKCPSSFKYQKSIAAHISSKHNILKSKSDSRIDEKLIKVESTQQTKGEGRLFCVLCDRSYARQHDLDVHTAFHHRTIEKKDVKCEDGSSSFNFKKNLDRHQTQECHGSLEKKQADVGRRSTRIRFTTTKFEP